VRGDRISCIDRNPKADHVGRWGHVGRESGVQEKLQTYLALHEATPRAAKIGEWIGEFQPMFLDMNAGSICLKREYPDGLERPAEENVIPVPLFQMVYGDSELFVVRVGAASDAHMAPQDPDAIIPAEVTRRGSALFGAVHQVLYWGGVRWAGEAFNRLRVRTWMVVRDNVARRTLLGRPADFHMLDGGDQETPGLFSVRRTAWLDAKQSPLALHWDNNTGASTSASGELDGRALRIDNLWGAPEALPGSLGRLKPGSTVTVTRDGTFCLWSFAGTVESDGVPWVTVGDSASTPAGLSVIWDGEFLSLSNESAEPRTVTVRVAGMPGELVPVPDLAPLTPDGEATEGPSMVYNQATEWSQTVEGGVRVLKATLPGATRAAADRAIEVPATLAAFTSR